MQVQHITKNTLKISLSQNETNHYFGTINIVDKPSKIVVEALKNIFKNARKQCGFFDCSSEMLVEILKEKHNRYSIYCTTLGSKHEMTRLYYLSSADSIITLYLELPSQQRKQIKIIKLSNMYLAFTEINSFLAIDKELEKLSHKTQIVSKVRLAYIKEHGKEITL